MTYVSYVPKRGYKFSICVESQTCDPRISNRNVALTQLIRCDKIVYLKSQNGDGKWKRGGWKSQSPRKLM